MEDIDLMFDMLLTPSEPTRLSKNRFKEYLVQAMGVKEHDADILLKTHPYLKGQSEWIDRQDFRNAFEQPIMQARQRQLEDYNDRMKKYQTAKNYLTTDIRQDTASIMVKNPFLNESINQR